MYRIIRVGYEYSLVIVTDQPEDSEHSKSDRYWRYATWRIHGHRPHIIHEITRKTALSYFSGMADGVGFESIPKQSFNDLGEVLAFINDKQANSQSTVTDEDLELLNDPNILPPEISHEKFVEIISSIADGHDVSKQERANALAHIEYCTDCVSIDAARRITHQKDGLWQFAKDLYENQPGCPEDDIVNIALIFGHLLRLTR